MPTPSNPQSWNRYSYVSNNPLRYTDPTGHMQASDNYQDSDGKCAKGDKGCNDILKRIELKKKKKFDNELDTPKDDELPLSEASRAMFYKFEKYCQSKNYACGNPDWPYQLNPFKDVDPHWLAAYDSEVYSTYAAQGINVDSVVAQNLNNPLDMNGQKGRVAEMYFRTKSNPVYNYFLKNAGLDPTRPANLEAYYLVKMIQKKPDAFREAIDKCGEWCLGGDVVK